MDTNRALVKAVVDAQLFSFPGKGHVPWGNLAAEPAAGASASSSKAKSDACGCAGSRSRAAPAKKARKPRVPAGVSP